MYSPAYAGLTEGAVQRSIVPLAGTILCCALCYLITNTYYLFGLTQ